MSGLTCNVRNEHRLCRSAQVSDVIGHRLYSPPTPSAHTPTTTPPPQKHTHTQAPTALNRPVLSSSSAGGGAAAGGVGV